MSPSRKVVHMCRMVGVVFKGKFPVETLVDLQHVAKIGKVPEEEVDGHMDGWGIVSFMNRSPKLVGKSERPAYMDPSFDSAVRTVPELESPNILIAHVRRASRGDISLKNTHPFICEGIVFAHNGTVDGLRSDTTRKPKGETDSERLLMLLADKFDKTGDLESALKRLIKENIRTKETYTAMMLVSDGKRLFGYRGFTRQDREWYYKLKIAQCSDYVAIFQESINESEMLGSVSELENGELVSVGLGLDVKREMVR